MHLARCKHCEVAQVILVSKRLLGCWTWSTVKKNCCVILPPKRDSVGRGEKTMVKTQLISSYCICLIFMTQLIKKWWWTVKIQKKYLGNLLKFLPQHEVFILINETNLIQGGWFKHDKAVCSSKTSRLTCSRVLKFKVVFVMLPSCQGVKLSCAALNKQWPFCVTFLKYCSETSGLSQQSH